MSERHWAVYAGEVKPENLQPHDHALCEKVSAGVDCIETVGWRFMGGTHGLTPPTPTIADGNKGMERGR